VLSPFRVGVLLGQAEQLSDTLCQIRVYCFECRLRTLHILSDKALSITSLRLSNDTWTAEAIDRIHEYDFES
jgi:hypothetical protein